jgi:hypothetical protein
LNASRFVQLPELSLNIHLVSRPRMLDALRATAQRTSKAVGAADAVLRGDNE